MGKANFEPCEGCHEAPGDCVGTEKCDIAKKTIAAQVNVKTGFCEDCQKKVKVEVYNGKTGTLICAECGQFDPKPS